MKKFVIGLACFVGLTLSGDAWALSCEEIMNMVNVNVPTSIIVQTMEDSGETFSNDDIRCLLNEGAPDEVVKTAKSMSATSRPEETPSGGERDNPEVKKSTDGDWETTERIGEKKGRKEAYEDLPEEGERSETSGGECGAKVDDAVSSLKANKPLSASKKLFDLLEEGTCPEQTSRMHYYLGRALYDLEMFHSAQYYFMQVVKKGPANPYFKHALPKVVAIARHTGDDSELMRVVPKIPPDEYPRAAKNYLYYLMGVRLYDENK